MLYKDDNTAINPPDWHGEMKTAIESLTDCNDPRQLPRILGYKLRTYQKRIIGGRFIDKASEGARAGVLWVVRSAKEFRGANESGTAAT